MHPMLLTPADNSCTMPAPYNPVCLMDVFSTERAPITETSPFNMVHLMVAKIRYENNV